MTIVEMKLEHQKHKRALVQIDELISGLKYGSLEWSNMVQAKSKIERATQTLLVNLNDLK